MVGNGDELWGRFGEYIPRYFGLYLLILSYVGLAMLVAAGAIIRQAFEGNRLKRIQLVYGLQPATGGLSFLIH